MPEHLKDAHIDFCRQQLEELRDRVNPYKDGRSFTSKDGVDTTKATIAKYENEIRQLEDLIASYLSENR